MKTYVYHFQEFPLFYIPKILINSTFLQVYIEYIISFTLLVIPYRHIANENGHVKVWDLLSPCLYNSLQHKIAYKNGLRVFAETLTTIFGSCRACCDSSPLNSISNPLIYPSSHFSPFSLSSSQPTPLLFSNKVGNLKSFTLWHQFHS